MAVLLEVILFTFYRHHSFGLKSDPEFAFRSEGRPSAMIVISDGDIARNKALETSQGWQIYPLGYDRYAQT